jgi:hypothetical protein
MHPLTHENKMSKPGYHDLEYEVPILHERARFTRPYCPECQEPFVGWREGPSGIMNAVCLEAHTWVTERYIDHGSWDSEEAE